ncbi:MAG TPA: hypothetical protein ENI94_13065 [Gammaproteobacteria bacterium]|nr:hypothetical protein [Gammaproteobacteria bacterium]
MKFQTINLIIIGFVAGAVSWAVVSIVSDKFEPFDSSIGFISGQIILSSIAFWIGYKKRIIALFIYLLTSYLGMNVYAYVFGSSEQKAWILLGMFSALFLMFFPLLSGVIGKIINTVQYKYNNRVNSDG